jgi:FemAB-related protein (PEP-CTERM system-associated)
MGGIISDNREISVFLINEAVRFGLKKAASIIEFRHQKPLEFIHSNFFECSAGRFPISTNTEKIRMILELPESSDKLLKSFKSKLRSQIKKPIKEGLRAAIGKKELLNDFYRVFTINMRDLGSPVHSRKLFENVLTEFDQDANIVVVYHGKEPVAGSVIIGFKDILENPWASSLRKYSRLSPNMLLYWTMLEHACDHGYRYFDFGRSTHGEGTYKFKEQWGAKPHPLYWYTIHLDGSAESGKAVEKSKFDLAIKYWKMLPVAVTKVLGPRIRKNIGL